MEFSSFSSFDPLQVKLTAGTEAQANALRREDDVKIYLKVVDKDGKITETSTSSVEYLWTHLLPQTQRHASIDKIQQKRDELYKKGKDPNKLPSSLQNLEVIYRTWNFEQLISELKLESEEIEICNTYKPRVYGGYVFSTKKWEQFKWHQNYVY